MKRLWWFWDEVTCVLFIFAVLCLFMALGGIFKVHVPSVEIKVLQIPCQKTGIWDLLPTAPAAMPEEGVKK